MYLSDSHKSRPPPPPPPAIDFYKDHHHHHHVDVDAEVDLDRDMMIEVVTSSSDPLPPHHPLVIAAPGDSGSGGDDPDPHASACGVRSSPSSSAVAPKKRAETWVQDETRSLISLRRDMDSLFNTSKSNKHLWEQISSKMREKGFDRSPTMCTDKWRNLLKEFKKAKQHNNNASASNGGAAKMSYYKEIDEILRERSRHTTSSYKSPNNTLPSTSPVASAKVDSFMQFSDNKGIEDTSIPYGPIEANDRQTLNLERTLDHDGHPLAITAADTVGANGVPSSIWRDGNGDETQSFVGRVITVKWVAYTRRIGIDGTADAISHAIKSAFGIRTKRAFWLEDEDQIVRSLDRDMPLGNYTLHLDEGVTIKVCHCDESGRISLQNTEEKTFYSDDDLREYLHRRGWLALKELQGYRSVDHLDDLRCDGLYRGVT